MIIHMYWTDTFSLFFLKWRAPEVAASDIMEVTLLALGFKLSTIQTQPQYPNQLSHTHLHHLTWDRQITISIIARLALASTQKHKGVHWLVLSSLSANPFAADVQSEQSVGVYTVNSMQCIPNGHYP